MSWMYTIRVQDGERTHTVQVRGSSSLLGAINEVVAGETEIRYIAEDNVQLILIPDDTPEFLNMSRYSVNWVVVTSRVHSQTNTSEDLETDSTVAEWLSNSSEDDQENDVE